MPSIAPPEFVRLAKLGGACAMLALLVAGCGSNTTSEKLKDTAVSKSGLPAAKVVKFAGTVTIDGKRPADFNPSDVSGPQGGSDLLVILNDPTKLPTPTTKTPPLYTVCSPDGKFAFSTYMDGDGVPAGKYVVTFVKLQRLGSLLSDDDGYKPPDELKNRYNDPEKNAQVPENNINLEGPGKSDYVFNLEVEGKQGVNAPGPHAITAIDSGRQGIK
jgi:hypothetical protein